MSNLNEDLFSELVNRPTTLPEIRLEMPKESELNNGVAFYNPEEDDLSVSEAEFSAVQATSPPRPLTINMTKNDTVEQLRKCTLRQVDSEIFDNDSFIRYAQSPGGTNHAVSQPFEMSGCPIESLESRNHLVKELSNRARLENSSGGNGTELVGGGGAGAGAERATGGGIGGTGAALSPLSPNGFPIDEMMPRSKSPQMVEMHTFRDAIDVNYQRMAITGEEFSGVPLEDHAAAAKCLIMALEIREEYMKRIDNRFPSTVSNFLHGEYPLNLPKCRKKNTESTAEWKRTETDPYLEERRLRKRGRGGGTHSNEFEYLNE